ncbi:host specificity factor TipJ family phage tail protein [Acinetobacter lwoffii]|uniref:host specificity factor TipJ family phage tail protein n=1 Tax=Acinetobacter lwoffii TaxID=28090 RepID=UPI00168D309F|nr:host specificity factor TipJ family phage tail protein [Acinetobacter lwoffii]
MSRLRIFRNPVDGGDEVLHIRTDKVLETFIEVKKKSPQARIFSRPTCQQNDVTPSNHIDAASLQMLAKTNDFDIVCEAGEPLTIFLVATAVLSAGLAIYTYLNMPDVPQMDQKSGNNELSNRNNRERIKGRVPDIYGTVKSVPDLVTQPILYYKEDGVEIEECLMCLGRGEFEITDIKDGDTFGSTIDGFSTSVYAPGMNLTGTPQIQIGRSFTEAPLIGKKSSAITGQTLPDPTEPVIDTAVEGTMYPKWPNRLYLVGGGLDATFTAGESVVINAEQIGVKDVQLSGSTNVERTGVITIGSPVNIESPNDFKGIQIDTLLIKDTVNGILDLSGRYTVSSISKSGSYAYEITLVNPVAVNPNWALMTTDNLANSSNILTNNSKSINISGSYANITSVTSDFIELDIPVELQSEWGKLNGITVNSAVIDLQKYKENWLGWFYINSNEIEKLIFNFYFPKGVFSVGTNGKNYHHNIAYMIDYQELRDNQPYGPVSTFSYAETYKNTSAFGLSKIMDLNGLFAEGVRVRVRRTYEEQGSAKTTRVNEIKLKSVYACSYLKKLVYPKVTMVRSETVATDGALSVKERQWNCIATQKLYSYASGERSLNKQPTSDFADIVTHITLDPLIGRRELADLDVQGIYATSQEIKNYFGTPLAAHFNYTFDQGSQSFEEALAQIASCVGSNARREGSQIYFQFEKENPNSSILFNHRNKRPFSETRSEKYGIDREYDGVEVSWIDPADGWVESIIRLPDDFITNPKKLELAGVTNKYQAHFLAHRAWNKIQYQREMVKFTAYGEADLVSLNDRIAVVDDVVPTLTSSGDITYWQGQNISISQPVELDPTKSYTIHLQHLNRSVETMLVTQGADEYSLILERLPVLPLVVKHEYDEYAKYSITLSTEKDSEAFLITEKSHSGPFESEVTAINYDARYYSNDKDHINNLI